MKKTIGIAAVTLFITATFPLASMAQPPAMAPQTECFPQQRQAMEQHRMERAEQKQKAQHAKPRHDDATMQQAKNKPVVHPKPMDRVTSDDNFVRSVPLDGRPQPRR